MLPQVPAPWAADTTMLALGTAPTVEEAEGEGAATAGASSWSVDPAVLELQARLAPCPDLR